MRQSDKEYIENRRIVTDAQYCNYGFHFCEKCGRSDGYLDCHHIIFRSEKPNHRSIHNIDNLILLCRDCHKLFHDKKGTRNDLVESRKLHLIFGNDILNK